MLFAYLFSAMALEVLGSNPIKVTYNRINNGKVIPNSEITLIYHNQIAYLDKDDAKIRQFMDFSRKQNVTILKYNGELYKANTPFETLTKPEFKNNQDTIMGYICDYAWFFSFSNKIEVWFTEQTGAKGSPYSAYLPGNKVLALKIVINGNRTILADSIEEITEESIPEYPYEIAKEISIPELEELKIKSRYVTLKIFNEETINFDNAIKPTKTNDTDTSTVYHFLKGTITLKKIKLPEIHEKGARVFAKLTSWSNGDAYDRTGSVFIVSPTEEKSSILDALQYGLDRLPVYTDNADKKYQGIVSNDTFDTPIEIMRFFTSFGVRDFNTRRVINNYPWKDAAEYKQEVTSVIPGDVDEIWVGVFIGNYDKGGHKVSLEFDFYPSFGDEEKMAIQWVKPIFNTVNILEMSGQNYGRLFKTDTLKATFDLHGNIDDLQLLFTSTGHGGWGQGDEFVPKLNQVFIDGVKVFTVVPWRTDCATYRLYNPASGNFGNGMSSSDLSRSNWCPATLTPPYLIPLDQLQEGQHTLEVVIDQGEDEGGSFSHWSVSGTLTGQMNKAE